MKRFTAYKCGDTLRVRGRVSAGRLVVVKREMGERLKVLIEVNQTCPMQSTRTQRLSKCRTFVMVDAVVLL